MDSQTHTLLAARLLHLADSPLDTVGCALLPQIDRQPAYLHRLYAHALSKANGLISKYHELSLGKIVDRDDYESERIRAEVPRFERHIRYAQERTGGVTKTGVWHQGPARLAFVSHLYSDLFNNPVQAFAPWNWMPSGAWNLWAELGSLEFRPVLYDANSIKHLHNEVFPAELWTGRFSADQVTAAMIKRLADHSASRLSERLVEQATVAVLEDMPKSADVSEAVEFLVQHEDCLARSIKAICLAR